MPLDRPDKRLAMKNETFKLKKVKGFKGSIIHVWLVWMGLVVMPFGALAQDIAIKTGAAQPEKYLELLLGKKVGVIANHTSMVDSMHLIDFLLAKGVAVKKVFAPEHGFRGTASAGAHIKNDTDPKTGLPIVSLYGNRKKPTASDLEGLDLLIFDIQDVGVRFYTYISTMSYCMEAAAENGLDFMVLDRPNPNGHFIDGPILEPENSSFVGLHPVPIVHGLTVAEYAQMVNEEGWLANGVKVRLHWVLCEGYTHQSVYVLPIPPSPNLPNQQAIYNYPTLCLFEGTTISVGRGTDFPFQVYGAPQIKGGAFEFVPQSKPGAQQPLHEGKVCYGFDLRGAGAQPYENLQIDWWLNAYQKASNKPTFFNNFFVKLSGTKTLTVQIQQNVNADEIRSSWAAGLEKFYTLRAQYALYPL